LSGQATISFRLRHPSFLPATQGQRWPPPARRASKSTTPPPASACATSPTLSPSALSRPLAFLFVGVRLLLPGQESGFDFEREFELARGLVGKEA